MAEATKEQLEELEKATGLRVVPVTGLPFVLVRWDWLQTAMRWLAWAQANMKPEKLTVDATDPLVPSGNVLEFLTRCIEELAELQRVGKAVQLGSPLTYMRTITPSQLEPEVQLTMPPHNPGERGN